MKINVGTLNPVKIQAVNEALKLYPKLFPEPEITGIKTNALQFGHPKNLKKTVEGAIKRAKEAYVDCDYSIGIEGGLVEVPYTETGYLEMSVCAIYTGKKIHIGLSPSFEWPKQVTELILSNKADGSQAFKIVGLTQHEKIGAVKGGILGVLTNNRITREEFTKYSIIVALIHLEKPDLHK